MASPSLASSQAMALDPHRQARFKLHIGEGVMNRGSTKRKYNAVKYNHKPAQSTDSSRTTQITSSTSNSKSANLRITDSDDGTYRYTGQRQMLPEDSYFLIFDTNKQTCTLEPLSSSIIFNLESAPTESSSAALSKRYPPIPSPDEERGRHAAEELFEENPADDGPDPNNPFDYRHFLNQREERSPSPLPGGPVDSPRLKPATIKSERASAASTPKVQAQQPRPKFKVSQIAKKGAKPRHTTSTTTPSVRLERHASTRSGQLTKKSTTTSSTKGKKPAPKSAEFVHDSSSSSPPSPDTRYTLSTPQPKPQEQEPSDAFDGGLEIDFGDSGPPTRKTVSGPSLLSSAAAELVAATHNGPISLRSAANSPGDSRVTTPRPRQKVMRRRPTEVEELDLGDAGGDLAEPADEDEEEGYVEDNESDDEDVPVKDYSMQQKRSRADTLDNSNAIREEDGEEDAEGEDDVDVEPMTLGSPAQHVPQQQQHDVGQQQEQDDDIDMDAAFEAEMMQGLQDDEEESDVSEAE